MISNSNIVISTCHNCFRIIANPRRHSFTAHIAIRNSSQLLQAFDISGGHIWRRPSPPVTVQVANKSTVKLEDLCQGVIPLDPLPLEDGAPTYPTVLHQARTNMHKFENCVLLTRVGGFYELYFEQAEEFGPVLNLKVARKRTNAGPVSMV
jgi:hypothetical protein